MINPRSVNHGSVDSQSSKDQVSYSRKLCVLSILERSSIIMDQRNFRILLSFRQEKLDI